MVVAVMVLLSVGGVVLVYFLTYFLHGRVVLCKSTRRLDGKTVIITGGSSGIGKATAMDLASRGAHVIITGSQTYKGQAAARDIREQTYNNNVIYIPMDLANTNSIREFATFIYNTIPRVDILINNAAVAYHHAPRTEDGYDAVFGINYIGHFLLTYLLLDLLIKSAPSRIVNVSSMAHGFGGEPLNYEVNNQFHRNKLYPFLSGYESSKLALVMHAKELARRLADQNVMVNSCHPGIVMTALWRGTEAWLGRLLFRGIVKVLLRPVLMSAHDAAQTVIHCAVSEDLDHVTGKYFKACTIAKESPHARDPELSAKLWDISLFLTGCNPSMTLAELLAKRVDQTLMGPPKDLAWWEVPGVTFKEPDPDEVVMITRG